MRHVTIYREEGRYAGWPANYGIWSWGDEIVVGFTVGYKKLDAGFHARDREKPFVGMQARSVDGGEIWEATETSCRTPGGRGLSADEHMDLRVGQVVAPAPADCPGGIDLAIPTLRLCAPARGWKRVRHPGSILPAIGAGRGKVRSAFQCSGR